MAQNYTLMARKNLLKPSETPKFYAVARSGRKVTVKEVCKRITECSSYSKGELEGCIGEFLLEIVNVLEEGNIVQMGDLGNFRMSIKTGTLLPIRQRNSRHRALIRAKCSFIRVVISASCVRRWIIHCIRVILPLIWIKIRFLMMAVMIIREVPAAGKLRTRQHNQPVVDGFLSS